MQLDIFDARAEEMGATTDAAKADLVGVDRATLWRWRKGYLTPSLDTVMAIAAKLDIPLSDLVKREAAA
jgi:transcriptional regulator with XRE-family HTH domain